MIARDPTPVTALLTVRSTPAVGHRFGRALRQTGSAHMIEPVLFILKKIKPSAIYVELQKHYMMQFI